jgi:hypothetical protein
VLLRADLELPDSSNSASSFQVTGTTGACHCAQPELIFQVFKVDFITCECIFCSYTCYVVISTILKGVHKNAFKQNSKYHLISLNGLESTPVFHHVF